MTFETRTAAFDPFLTMRAQFSLLMESPSPLLLIDGDNLTVTNAVDRTDDPAVLITGSNNVFINQTGATLTGTGTGDRLGSLDGAIEVGGTGNQIQNQLGAVVTGVNGIVGTGSGTAVVNDGSVLAANVADPFSGNSTAISLGVGATVQNSGLVRAEATDIAAGITLADGGAVDNTGVVEATAGFAAVGIALAQDGLIVNSGDVAVSAGSDSVGLLASSSGAAIRNSGSVHATLDSSRGNAFGISALGGSTAWNGGTIDVTAASGGNAYGMVAIGGSVENDGDITVSATQPSEFVRGSSIGIFLNAAAGSNAGTITASTVGGQSIGVASLGGVSPGSIEPFANSGDILATGVQAYGFIATNLGTLTNTGTITAAGPLGAPAGFGISVALDFQNDASVGNSGLVRAESGGEATAVSADDRADIRNDGTLEAIGEFASGIEVGSDGTVLNAVTGVVRAQASGQVTAISAGDRASIQNDGIVEAAGEFAFGIDIGSDGMMVNTGTVDVAGTFFAVGLSGGSFSTIHNLGTVHVEAFGQGKIAFGAVAPGSGILVNWGTIEAVTDDGNALAILASGSDSRVENHGELRSISTGSDTGSRSDALVLFGASGLNTGSILASAVGGGSAGALLGLDSSLENTGDITAIGPDAIGVGLGGLTELTNTGSISAIGPGARAVVADADTVITNDGMITAQSADAGAPSVGIAFETVSQAHKTLVNSGTIVADLAILDTVAAPLPGSDVLTIENSGLVAGRVELGDGIDIVTNTGIIDGDVDLGAGNDVFDGRGGQMSGTVFGGGGDDIIRAGAGNDILIGGDGNDIIAGGAGADVIDGGAGLDTLDYSESASGVQVFLGDATLGNSAPLKAEAGTAFGGDAEGDTFQGIEKVIGSAFGDFVYGAPGGSIVELGGGNDIFANQSALSGDDVIDLGAGDDIAFAGAGSDLVQGGSGQDWLFGEDGNDFLLGQEGNDRLRGGQGDDRLDGGAGDDLLTGGLGNDLFEFGLGGGNDTILDFEAGAGSDDVVDLTAFDTILSFDDVLAIATQTTGGGQPATVLTFDATTTLTFEGVRLAELNEADFVLV